MAYCVVHRKEFRDTENCPWCRAVTPPKPVESQQEMHTDLCGRCGKDASHELCPMRDCISKDTPCVHCGAPVYYSFGYKVYAHEGRKPSLKYRLSIRDGDWGKWTDCQNPDGSKMGTTAEPKPAPQTCEHGVLTADHCKTCDPAPQAEIPPQLVSDEQIAFRIASVPENWEISKLARELQQLRAYVRKGNANE